MNWHSIGEKTVLQKLETQKENGLGAGDVKTRLLVYGENTLPKTGQKSVWFFLAGQLKSPLVYILIIASFLTAGMAIFAHSGESGIEKWVDTIVILLAVLMNVLVGFFQEFRASNILEKLTKAVHTSTLVRRDGGIHEVDTKGIVPGDIVLLRSGKKVPADVRILCTDHLEIDESPLTGESEPVKKNTQEVSFDTLVSDRMCMAYMGTIVTRGEGLAVAVETGVRTQIGEIALLTQTSKEEETPLQKRVMRLGKIAAIFIAFASFAIFLFGQIAGRSLEQMLTTTIAIFVAAVPEGLPAAISICLAVAAQQILGKKGVVKRLVSAETLGSCSVICTDKTGTLTEGIMRVEKLEIKGEKKRAYENLALSNEALLEEGKKGETLIRGETTDQAKMRAFLDNGGDLGVLLEGLPRVSLLGFDASRNYIASFHQVQGKQSYALYVSGAPESVLALCKSVIGEEGEKRLTSKKREQIRVKYEKLAKEGYRMIALAERHFDSKKSLAKTDLEDRRTREELVSTLAFVGFAAIRDPIRKDVPRSIKEARRAGIRIVMMTGDHILTARSIGRELGFRADEDTVMEGYDLEKMSERELAKKLKVVEIFARVSPEHKMRIIERLQKSGEVVAMTGDGVNDAPALKRSDIGVAVNSGTDIAKEASTLVLLDDSFTTIVEAIKRGRIAFSNIRKVCIFLFSASFTELVLILVAVFLNLPYLPLTAVMILWTNLVGDSLPNIALAFEPGEEGIMKRKPIRRDEPIFDAEGKMIVGAVVTVSSIILFALFLWLSDKHGMEIAHIQTIIFAALGISTFFYVYSIKSLKKPIWSYNIFSNRILLVSTVFGSLLMILAVYAPFLNLLLGTVPLSPLDWTIVLATGIINMMVVELVKYIFMRSKIGVLIQETKDA